MPFVTAFTYIVFAWFIFTTLMLICTLRTNVAFVLLFFALDMTFLFLALADYQGSPACKKAGGIFGGCPSHPTNCQRMTSVC
jgi:succinate-acetate transporter protein